MSIDQTSATGGQKTSAASDSRSGRGKAGDSVEAAEGGFASLLSTINPTVESPVVETDVSKSPPDNEKELKDDVSLLAPTPQITSIDLSSLIESQVGGSMVVDEKAILENKGLNAVNLAVGSADGAKNYAGLQHVGSTNIIAGESVMATAGAALADEDLGQSGVENRLDMKAQKLVQARHSLAEGRQSEMINARLESKAVSAALDLDLSGKDATQTKLSLLGDFAARVWEPIERPKGRSFGSTGVSGTEAGWTQYAHHARAAGDMPSSANAVTTTPAQMQVADKVSYWVTQGIQNAELSLDGFGTGPVEVSILLKGGEAHVGFRSDQPDVRQLLEGALSQLKDSLAREGVVLLGATVGGSGTDGGGRQQDQRREPGANRGGGAVKAPTEVRILAASASVGRSLDIFV